MAEMAAALFNNLVFKVAAGAETGAALDLRRAVYARDWPDVPLEQVIDRRDDSAYHLIAVSEQAQIIAALRIVVPEHRPFDMEEFITLDGALPPDRHPAEIGRLCVSHATRHVRAGSFVHLGMLKLAVNLAPRIGITDFLLTAIPKLRGFYLRGGFRDVGITFEHATWGLVHVMRLDLLDLADPTRQVQNSVERILRGAKPPNFIL
jgi:predicted GNAT family N-acyltransferase